MVVLSKILHPFVTRVSCHELFHTWTPSCSGAAVEVFGSCMLEALKIYGLLYLVSKLYQITRHCDRQYLKRKTLKASVTKIRSNQRNVMHTDSFYFSAKKVHKTSYPGYPIGKILVYKHFFVFQFSKR